MSDFTNFRAVYDDLTDEVARARYQFLPDHLRNWFEQLDQTPTVNEIVEELQSGLDFDRWLSERKATAKGMAGSGKLTYPQGKTLGMKLLLFRSFADGKQDAWQFATTFVYSKGDMNALTQGVIEQVFMPLARELRRYLETEVARRQAGEVPASDRQVTVDHNSKAYADAETAMEKLETAIREANDFEEPEEQEQRQAEVSAAKRLMQAVRVRLEPLAALLKPILVQAATKVKDNLVAAAALAVSTALITLFGVVFRALLGL